MISKFLKQLRDRRVFLTAQKLVTGELATETIAGEIKSRDEADTVARRVAKKHLPQELQEQFIKGEVAKRTIALL